MQKFALVLVKGATLLQMSAIKPLVPCDKFARGLPINFNTFVRGLPH
jgi:hypothetical protein